jgi:hypothetical protein
MGHHIQGLVVLILELWQCSTRVADTCLASAVLAISSGFNGDRRVSLYLLMFIAFFWSGL